MAQIVKEKVDPEFLERAHDAFARILLDRRSLQGEIKNLKRLLRETREDRDKWKDYAGRLHEKAMALESIPDGVLDAWDEQYLMDTEACLYFTRKAGGLRKVVLERKGFGRLERRGKPGDKMLRSLIEEASGRKRSSPAPQTSA